MKWKKIVTAILRILWMLRLATPPDKKNPETEEDEEPTPPLLLLRALPARNEVSNLPPLRSKSELRPNVAAPAVVTFGPRCSRPLPRSQVLSSLLSDCRHSTRRISLLVLHCSDTRPDQSFTIEKLLASHRARGFGTYPGYHLYVRRDGTLYYCRPVDVIGCHVKGYNRFSIGICYEGGHSCSPEYKYEDNRTAEQLAVLHEVFMTLHACYPEARIVGHNELNRHKACPCLRPKASVEYRYIFS